MAISLHRRCLYLLLGWCLVGLLAACASPTNPGTTAGSGTTPTTNVVPTQASTVPIITPTQVITPTTKLSVAIACGGTKQDGYGLDVAHGKVCAQTMPGAKLSIQVNYCDGKPDPSSVLQGSVTADAKGFHEWDWTPRPDCKGQPIWGWKVTITAQLNSQIATEVYQAIA